MRNTKSHKWVVDWADRELCFCGPDGYKMYRVDLERCQTSAQVLDWIMQVAGKAWANDHVIADMVRAIDKYANPQRNMCSHGEEKGPYVWREEDTHDERGYYAHKVKEKGIQEYMVKERKKLIKTSPNIQ